MAPEVYKDEIFDRSVDAYSFGLILYEVHYGFMSTDFGALFVCFCNACIFIFNLICCCSDNRFFFFFFLKGTNNIAVHAFPFVWM